MMPGNYGSALGRPGLYGGFGGFSTSEKAVDISPSLVLAQRQRINTAAVCQAFFVPWLLFCFIYAVMSFSLHYTQPALSWLFVGCGAWVTFLVGLSALRLSFVTMRGEYDREPSWLIFLFVSMLMAMVLGVVFGQQNFWADTQPYYDLLGLSRYTGVSPAGMRGQQLMDAGQVFFAEGAQLDLRKSMGFQNMDTYCVAPITIGNEAGPLPLASYDFWAVGLDCCSASSSDFRCGEFNNPRALAGLRLMNDDQRSFFRLAVQQAESAYNIRATHPLFFYWMQSPEDEMSAYRAEAYKHYFLGMTLHFCFQLLCVSLAARAFSKSGHF